MIDKITARFNANVLVGEDYPLNSAVIKKMLEIMGCNVTINEDGDQVYQHYLGNTYDIIFMDVQMPRIDGYEVTKQIRNYEKSSYKHVPIIAVTANALIGDKEKCLSSGMDDYISKPIRGKDIEKMLIKYVPHLELSNA
jgi:CheY-like chemotaxis protein